MEYKSYMCATCDNVCGEDPIRCVHCDAGNHYRPKSINFACDPVTFNAGEFPKALKEVFNSNYGAKSNKFLFIRKVIFDKPATIVFWSDDTKTVVKCGENDTYDPEKGLAMAIAKKVLGNKGNYYNAFKKWLPEDETGADE